MAIRLKYLQNYRKFTDFMVCNKTKLIENSFNDEDMMMKNNAEKKFEQTKNAHTYTYIHTRLPEIWNIQFSFVRLCNTIVRLIISHKKEICMCWPCEL